jgi:large subunit ribosomal protein L25
MELVVQKREILGKKLKSLRGEGLIPAELYGRGFENTHLSVAAKDFISVFKKAGESVVVKLKIKNGGEKSEEINVLIHDIQRNPTNDEITHIDFYQVRMDEKITASVPLEFIGEAPAVKEKVGVLNKSMREIEVEALPGDLPQSVKVDISVLSNIGASIRVKDLRVGKGVKILIEPETVLATIVEQAKEEVEIKPASVEDVKVEGEEKKKEEAKEEK